jgi:cytochrome c biogenesis protein CcdA
MKQRFIITIIILFALVCAGSYALTNADPAYRLTVLIGGNLIMATLSLLTFMMVTRQAGKNPAAFVRGVSASTFLKLMVCAGGILIYLLVQRGKGIHKPSVYMLLGIYAIYTITETWMLSRHVRNVK